MGESEDTVAAAAIDEPKMRGDLQDDKPEPASTAGEREQAEDQELEDGEVDDEPELVAAKAALTDQCKFRCSVVPLLELEADR